MMPCEEHWNSNYHYRLRLRYYVSSIILPSNTSKVRSDKLQADGYQLNNNYGI
jgi:hypothetical protein